MDRPSLLEKLVCTGHLNVPERRALGRVTRAEVAATIAHALDQNGGFPPSTVHDVDCIYEGPRLAKTADGYLAIVERHAPVNPKVLAASAQRRFHSRDLAVDWYIQQEWGSSIDGIAIEE